MGAAFGSSCYGTPDAAAAAACAGAAGVTGAGYLSCTSVADVSGSGASLSLLVTGPTGAVTISHPVTFGQCDPIDFAYWQELAGMYLGALVVLWGLRRVYRVFSNPLRANDGY